MPLVSTLNLTSLTVAKLHRHISLPPESAAAASEKTLVAVKLDYAGKMDIIWDPRSSLCWMCSLRESIDPECSVRNVKSVNSQ